MAEESEEEWKNNFFQCSWVTLFFLQHNGRMRLCNLGLFLSTVAEELQELKNLFQCMQL